RLERFLGPFLSASLVVVFGIVIITGTVYFTMAELTIVADEMAGYSDNIGNKLSALQKNSPQWLKHLRSAIADVERRVREPVGGLYSRPPQTIAVSSNSVTEDLERIAPVIAGIVQGLLVVALLFFLLYDRRDLRDRFVRLAARARIIVASGAIESA